METAVTESSEDGVESLGTDETVTVQTEPLKQDDNVQ